MRVIDANLNRVKEGLRVCEDISRFVLDARTITAQFKQIRLRILVSLKLLGIEANSLLESRNIQKDVGKKTTRAELLRKNLQDVFFANIQRVKESIRVLEEFTKIYNQKASAYFKNIRYSVYHLEKLVIAKFSSHVG